MDQHGDEKFDLCPFWFDSNKMPICLSYVWAQPPTECFNSSCSFSHDLIEYFCMLPITASLLRDQNQMYTHILEQVRALPDEQMYRVEVQDEYISSHDMNQLSELMEEMQSFETGELPTEVELCPQLQETGNCLLGASCLYPHEALNSDEIRRKGKAQEWHPSSRDCECCRGYKFGCEKEECQANGCTACQ